MLLAVLLIAANWGFTEAIVASIAVALGFDYFFLRPRGLRIEEPQYWLAQLAFVATAIIGSRLSTNIKKRAAEANASREDIEKLYKLQRLVHMDHNLLDNLERVPERIEQIFGFGGIACYFEGARGIHRSGTCSFLISDDELWDGASHSEKYRNKNRRLTVIPIMLGGHSVGNLGVHGARDMSPIARLREPHRFRTGTIT